MASMGQEFRTSTQQVVCLHSAMSGSQPEDSTLRAANIWRLTHLPVRLTLAVGWHFGWGSRQKHLYVVFPHGLLGFLIEWWLGSQGKERERKKRQSDKCRIFFFWSSLKIALFQSHSTGQNSNNPTQAQVEGKQTPFLLSSFFPFWLCWVFVAACGFSSCGGQTLVVPQHVGS